MSRCIFALLFLLFSSSCLSGEKINLSPFLSKYCVDCHHGGETQGGFELSSLGSDWEDERTLAEWVKMFDQIDHNQMPPEDSEQPGQ